MNGKFMRTVSALQQSYPQLRNVDPFALALMSTRAREQLLGYDRPRPSTVEREEVTDLAVVKRDFEELTTSGFRRSSQWSYACAGGSPGNKSATPTNWRRGISMARIFVGEKTSRSEFARCVAASPYTGERSERFNYVKQIMDLVAGPLKADDYVEHSDEEKVPNDVRPLITNFLIREYNSAVLGMRGSYRELVPILTHEGAELLYTYAAYRAIKPTEEEIGGGANASRLLSNVDNYNKHYDRVPGDYSLIGESIERGVIWWLTEHLERQMEERFPAETWETLPANMRDIEAWCGANSEMLISFLKDCPEIVELFRAMVENFFIVDTYLGSYDVYERWDWCRQKIDDVVRYIRFDDKSSKEELVRQRQSDYNAQYRPMIVGRAFYNALQAVKGRKRRKPRVRF